MYVFLTAAAILVCIFLEWKWHINMGLSAAVFAFLIACFGLGMSPGDLKNMLPIKIIFPVTAITTFYGFALENGALLKVVQYVIYLFRGKPGAIPMILFFMSALLGVAGMDAGSVGVIMSPIAMIIVTLGNLPLLPCAIGTLLGSAVGSNYMFSTGGTIMRGLVEETEFVNQAMGISLSIFLHNLICFFLLFLVIFLLFRGHGHSAAVEQPSPLDKKQKINLVLIGLFILTAAVPSILGTLTGNATIQTFARRLDVGFIALVFALIATLLHLGDATAVIKTRVPWRTLFMVSGVTMLIGVATEAGLMDVLLDLEGQSFPEWLIVPFTALVAGIMSFFSSAISVVIPTMFPLVPGLVAATGASPHLFYVAIALGAAVTALSPFSTGGSIMLSACTEEGRREKLMFSQLVCAWVLLVGVMIYCGVLAVF